MYTNTEVRVEERPVGTLSFTSTHDGHTRYSPKVVHSAFLEAKLVFERLLKQG